MPVSACKKRSLAIIIAQLLIPAVHASDRNPSLEEVVVTAQKREQSLQKIPVAVSVLDRKQLREQAISGMNSIQGAIPSLEGQPWGNTQNTWIAAIRGNGPIDAASATRDGAVGVYIDGIYLARPQALSLEMADLERIEVLRGPQGSLFGRNTTAGAVNFISEKPTIGAFEFEQTIGFGNYDTHTGTTHANLPLTENLSAKIDYAFRKHDGWVDNTAAHEHDFGERNDEGGRIGIRYQPTESVDINVALDKSRASSTMLYYQVYRDNGGLFGNERDRASKSRRPVIPLDPTVTRQQGYTATIDWSASPGLSAKAILGCRELKEHTGGNYAGTLYFNGFISNVDTDQHQCSVEFALQGRTDSIDWIAGLYNFGEGVHQNTQNRFSLDQFGILTGIPWSPIIPPTTINLFTGQPMPPKFVQADSESNAIYGQLTYTPGLDNRLHVTLGGRYTRDRKTGSRIETSFQKFDISEHSMDGTATLAYDIAQDISVYGKWASAYRAGGVNPGSITLTPYDSERVKSIELGAKSEFLEKRARVNIAAFRTFYDHMQIDVEDPLLITLTQTINAENTVRIEGVEFEGTFTPIDGLVIGLSYTYLNGYMPVQPNTLEANKPTQFQLTQTPRHAGAATLDYTFSPWRFGTLGAHVDVTSTDHYAHIPQDTRTDAYTLINARISLSDIPLGSRYGKLRASAWVKNLLDEEYIVLAYPNPPVDVVQQFGAPRTYGLELTYNF